MSDDTARQDEAAAEPAADAPARRPSPGVQAVSRARRIGGRPSPGARPSPRPSPRRQGEDADSPARDADAPADDSDVTDRAAVGGVDAVDDVDEQAGADEDVVAEGRPSRTETARLRRQIDRLRWIPAQVAAAAVVVLLALCIWQSHGVWWAKPTHDSGTQVRQQVLAAAKPCVAAIVSYDYRALDASERAGQACITGAFKNDYTKAMETTVKTLAPQTKTVQVFQIAKAGVERVSPDGKQWVVLLYGQQQVTNTVTAKDKPRLDILNVEATLNQVGNKWLVSSIH